MKTGTLSTTCAKPTAMYQLAGKKNKKTGKAVILQNPPDPGIPYIVIDRPCGQCAGCRIKRRMDWAIRLEHESKFHDHSWFITLTYDDENLPHGGSLVADHQSKFIKALRKKVPGKIRFFSIGEYGEDTLRPHYHLILFGPDFPDRELQYTAPIRTPSALAMEKMLGDHGAQYYKSKLLESVWAKGNVQLTPTSPATMQYVTKFHVEKVTGEKAETHYARLIPETDQIVLVEHPQTRMSRNPGIGRKWIEKYWTDVYPDGTMVDIKGAQFAPPSYYDDWLETHHPDVHQELKEKRSLARTLERELTPRREAKVAARKTKIDIAARQARKAKL